MMPETDLLPAIVALLVLVFGAPIIPGIATRTKAIMVGRRGSPVWQLYADLWKLGRRGIVYSTTTTWVFRLAPVVALAATFAAAALLPLDGADTVFAFAGDAVAFAYLLALGRFLLVLAALDTGSSFEGMGASREATFATLAELGLFIVLATLGFMAHGFSMREMLGTAGAGSGATSILLGLGVFVLALAECSRVPVDDPATHLELTMIHEVMVLDHSGPDLAMLLYAGALKLGLFASIIGSILLGGARPVGWAGVGALVASFAGLGVGVGLVESTTARLPLPKVPLYIISGAALALFGLILQLR